ncbi:hypothetical protein [Moorena sp. SIO4G3]|uniref:hypothetical protein n=1 Tax=Moorena sp. SIO4G3 TaxID=2607821 RepID=UPI001429C883|nr:hypothetical protein [Moorena sp. SIO4G3]NEO79278.1 hypothetical protein [Moorena sp. SIO4G3]
MGETTAVAHGGDPQDRAASPRPRCIAVLTCVKLPKAPLLPAPCSLLPISRVNFTFVRLLRVD